MAKNSLGHQNQLRIIAGNWRGRKLSFPDLPGLRPTSDRIRETLFNWLQADIEGSSCLDLFAGSGALGFEALSRGARRVIFVDAQRQAIEQIKQNAARLNVDNAAFMSENAASYLERPVDNESFDVVFLDPPFHQGLLLNCLQALRQNSMLNVGAKIYIEMEGDLDNRLLTSHWHVLRKKNTGNVCYCLLSREG